MNKLNVQIPEQNTIPVTNADSAVFPPGKADSALLGRFFELESHVEVNVGVF